MAQLKQGKLCPLMKKDCVGLKCSWYTQVRGKHPQTEAEIDEWACAIAWMPILMINTAQEVRQGAAATESLRNKLVEASHAPMSTLIAIASAARGAAGPALPGAVPSQANHNEEG